MKKTLFRLISIILLMMFVFSSSSFLIYASDTTFNTSNDIQKGQEIVYSKNILSFSCNFDPSLQTVNIKGTMNYDAFAVHGNSTLLIYSIPSGKTEYDILNDKNASPVVEAPVSLTFAFSFKLSSIVERYNRYAIFLKSVDDEYILTTESQYAEINAAVIPLKNKDSFKGLSGDYSSNISNVNSQSTIIPVYLDLIFTKDSNGYIYQIEDKQIFFNKNYVNKLDAQIRSLSLFDTTVYLQFLLRSGGILSTNMSPDAMYGLPNVFDDQTILYLHSVTDFLVSRYSDNVNGNILGIVLGKEWDNAAKYNSFKNTTFEQYVLMCGHYAAIISNAARAVDSNINIVLSFSGDGFYITSDENTVSDERLSSQILLSALMEYFDASSFSGLKCLFLIEASETPLDITVQDIIGGINPDKEVPNDRFYIGNHKIVSDFLEELSLKYKSADKYYSILWTPKKELRGNALCAAYAYSFYTLWTDNKIVGFNVEFSEKNGNIENLKDLLFVLENINTDKSLEVTENLLAFFNKKTWNEIIDVKEIPTISSKVHYFSNTLPDPPKNIKGEFCYFDFSKSFVADRWIRGVDCTDVKIEYRSNGEKALKTVFTAGNTDFCDLIYTYEYAENISYTPYIKFNLEISSEQKSSLYEIKFLFKGKNSTFESSSIIAGNQAEEIILDMSKAKEFSMLDSVKISVRSLDESSDNCILWINSITGLSKKYSDNKLNNLIEKERDKQKYGTSLDNANNIARTFFVIFIILFVAILGFILIFIFQKNNHNKRKE